MSESPFGAHRPNHGAASLHQYRLGTRRETPPIIIQPSDPSNHGISDERSKWNESISSDIGREHNKRDSPSSCQPATASLAKQPLIHIIPCHPGDTVDNLSSISTHELQGGPTDSPNIAGPVSPTHQYRNGSSATTVSPHYQDEGWKSPLHTSPRTRQITARKNEGGTICTSPIVLFTHQPIKSPQIRRAKLNEIQLESNQLDTLDFVQSTHVTGASPYIIGDRASPKYDSKRWQARVTIYIYRRTHLTCERKMSRAKQRNILLRRCFYPRRDVIKWIAELQMKLPCEVSNNIQGHLKISCSHLWRRVSLTSVRMSTVSEGIS